MTIAEKIAKDITDAMRARDEHRLTSLRMVKSALKNKEFRLTAASDEIRIRLNNFCSDVNALTQFYDEQLSLLGQVAPEEPPPLSI